MTPSFPDEAIHFRGKTLTPESPRPLHIPEPSNIPVLENQMDPVFNDTSTYEKRPSRRDDEQHPQAESDEGSTSTINSDANGAQEAMHRMTQAPDAYSNTVMAPSSDAQIFEEQRSSSSGSTGNGTYQQASPSIGTMRMDTNSNLLGSSVVTSGVDSASNNNPPAETGFDFQNLLDNIVPPATNSSSGSGASVMPSVPALESASPNITQPHSPQITDPNHALSAGLPPRPPAQAMPAITAYQSSSENAGDYHPPGSQIPNPPSFVSPPQAQDQVPSAPVNAPGVNPNMFSGVNGLPPPPPATFQQMHSHPKSNSSPETIAQSSHQSSRHGRHGSRSGTLPDDEAFWGAEVQKIYDEFLREERVYVTEGLWDRFPYGSRLFIGNLPSERVTKRDLFHVFHKYGKLAQISIKPAYGFIQFLDADSCHRALKAEQGGSIRGRKIHLEISKPQKNTRSGPNTADSSRQPIRRSRSPDHARNGPNIARGARNQVGDRQERLHDSKRGASSKYRDDHGHRSRDDYRPARSPSPRGFRNREKSFRTRERSPERFERRDRRRSRSPYSRDSRESRDRRMRTPSPRGRLGYEAVPEHAFSRRAPRDVPDLQILAADDVDMSFAYHVEDSFKARGLRTSVLVLSRISVDVAVNRQIEEGVFAVIRLTRSQQYSGKVTLLIFDRSAGPSVKPRPLEYPDLDLHAAVEMAVQMHTLRRTGATLNYQPPNSIFPLPSLPNQLPQQLPQVQPVLPQSNQLASLIQNLDGPALQSLLSRLQQTQPSSQPSMQSMPMVPNAPNIQNVTELANLMSNARSQQAYQPVVQNQRPRNQPINVFGLPPNNQFSNLSDPNLLAFLAKGNTNGEPFQGGQPPVGPQVQNIVNQLAKWRQ